MDEQSQYRTVPVTILMQCRPPDGWVASYGGGRLEYTEWFVPSVGEDVQEVIDRTIQMLGVIGVSGIEHVGENGVRGVRLIIEDDDPCVALRAMLGEFALHLEARGGLPTGAFQHIVGLLTQPLLRRMPSTLRMQAEEGQAFHMRENKPGEEGWTGC